MVTYQSIGKFTARTESYGKTTGGAAYTPDVDLPGMLWAKVLRSPVSHALIKSIDVSKAEALPGVDKVIQQGDHHELVMSDGASSQAVLRALMESEVEVRRFQVAGLPLDEIFVRIVKGAGQ